MINESMQEVLKMKKATSLLLVFLGMFLMLIIGVFIGRNSISGMVVITEAPIAQVQDNEVSHDVNSTDHNTNSSEIGKININTASMSLLQTLPNIGETLAKRIVDYRNEHGDFTAPEDLLLVEGIGEKRLEQIREYITVGG